jgi:GntR family transcriptional regulator / MocR family aminotransferase
MEFHVSLIDRKNLSGEIYRQIRGAILDGRLRPNDALPPTRELARALSISRTTVMVAYDRLAGEGFVFSRVGAGTFVTKHLTRRGTERPTQNVEGALRARRVWESIPLPSAFVRRADYDFRTGLPDTSLFPYERWRRLMPSARDSDDSRCGGYEHPAGHSALRAAVARHIGISRGVEALADDVIVTNGTQQAIDIIARVLLAPGDRVAVEDPGYGPARRVFKSHGARIVGVPVDRNGLIVDALPRNIRLVYVTPSHQYPLGVPLSLPRRRQLLSWAERNDAAIIEDDYDTEFRFDGRPIEPLRTLDTTGRVIYVGSFSKTLLPALRIGFMTTPASLRAAVHSAKAVTDWHTSTLHQIALARFIDDGAFARHIRRAGRVYGERHAVVVDTIAHQFSEQLELVPSAAGLHVAALACNASVERIAAVVRRASDVGIEVQALATFASERRAQAGLVIGYGGIATTRIEDGFRRLRRCFDA